MFTLYYDVFDEAMMSVLYCDVNDETVMSVLRQECVLAMMDTLSLQTLHLSLYEQLTTRKNHQYCKVKMDSVF